MGNILAFPGLEKEDLNRVKEEMWRRGPWAERASSSPLPPFTMGGGAMLGTAGARESWVSSEPVPAFVLPGRLHILTDHKLLISLCWPSASFQSRALFSPEASAKAAVTRQWPAAECLLLPVAVTSIIVSRVWAGRAEAAPALIPFATCSDHINT